MGQSIFEYAAAKECNDLPKELCVCETLRIFKIKTFKLLGESDEVQHKWSVETVYHCKYFLVIFNLILTGIDSEMYF